MLMGKTKIGLLFYYVKGYQTIVKLHLDRILRVKEKLYRIEGCRCEKTEIFINFITVFHLLGENIKRHIERVCFLLENDQF